MSAAISRFAVPERTDLPDDLADRVAEVDAKSGFVPNIFLALAHRPEEWRAFFAYHDALMDKETPGLTKADRELIVVATSAENHCLYCVVAHGAIARIRARNPRIADQVATDWRKAELDDRQRAVATSPYGSPSSRGPSPRTISPHCGSTGSPTTTSGMSGRSARCSRCPTGWCTWPGRCRTRSST
jgi:AhpD family alkylhydroperoxidase